MESLEILQENLTKSENLTGNMLGIIKSFENRLGKLEETILPIHKETANLQRRNENIDKTLSELDQVIGHFNASKETEIAMRNGPGSNLKSYLSSLAQLQKAMAYFNQLKTESVAVSVTASQVASSYETGRDALEREFRQILQRQTTPVPAVTILDAIAADDLDNSDTASIQTIGLKLMSEEVHDDLALIGGWLSAGNHGDYMNVYAKVRYANIIKTIEGLRDHFRAGSTDSLATVASPSNVKGKAHGSGTPVSKKAMKRLEFFRKASNSIKKQMARFESSGLSKAIPEEDAIDIDYYIAAISAELKLFQSEQSLMAGIIPEKHQRKTFDSIITSPLDKLVKEGEKICADIRLKLQRHEYTAVLSIFPVLKHLRALKPEFDVTMEGCQMATKTKIPTLILNLDTIGAKALDEFVDSLKISSEKNTHMPPDGTVHELTNNTVIFLEQLLEFQDTAGAMLLTKDPTSLPNLPHLDRSKLKLAEFITKVLSAIGLNLNNKSELYTDPTLRAVFLLNNYNYILKSLKRSGLMDLVNSWNNEVEKFYGEQIREQKRVYSRSWSRVIHYLTEKQGASSIPPDKLKERDRQIIKDKFTGFNKELDELSHTQKNYAIPDPDLRSALIKDNKTYVLPFYKTFLERYQNVPFSKNPEKYIRYSQKDVEKEIEGFFDSAA